MNEQQVNAELIAQMFPVWITNFRLNLQKIWASKCVSDLQATTHKPLAICFGAGPSLEKQLETIKNHPKGHGTMYVCCDKALKLLLDYNIYPDIVTCIDADPIVESFFPRVIKLRHDIKAVFSTTIDPRIVRLWPLDKTYFVNAHVCGRVSDPQGVDAALQIISGKTVMNTSGNVGMFNVILSAFLGAKTIALVGMDLSGHHEFYSDYAKTWITGLSRDLGIRIVNCTEGGTLYGEGLQEMPLKEFLGLL